MSGEQTLQGRIIKWLQAHGFWCFKTVVSSKAGIMDIVGCCPTGRFFGIEVKFGNNTASELQKYHIEEVKRRNGIALVAWDLETVIQALQGEIVELKDKPEADDEVLL